MPVHRLSANRRLIAVTGSICCVPATAFAQGLETNGFLWLGVLGLPIVVMIVVGLLVARIAKIKRYKGIIIVLLVFIVLWFGIPLLLYFFSMLAERLRTS
jgi:hypothetical protein